MKVKFTGPDHLVYTVIFIFTFEPSFLHPIGEPYFSQVTSQSWSLALSQLMFSKLMMADTTTLFALGHHLLAVRGQWLASCARASLC